MKHLNKIQMVSFLSNWLCETLYGFTGTRSRRSISIWIRSSHTHTHTHSAKRWYRPTKLIYEIKLANRNFLQILAHTRLVFVYSKSIMLVIYYIFGHLQLIDQFVRKCTHNKMCLAHGKLCMWIRATTTRALHLLLILEPICVFWGRTCTFR